MKTIDGIYASAKIFTTNNKLTDIDNYALQQLQMLCDNETSKGCVIRVMPDVHPGKVGTIGLTMTIGNKILPNLVGIDIGCGMTLGQIKARKIEFQKLDIPELQKLFDETYKIIECYSTESLVPKEISGLLLEMHDFSWWVSDLDETPMHTHYQEIVSLVNLLNKYFLTRDANTNEIERLIDELK